MDRALLVERAHAAVQSLTNALDELEAASAVLIQAQASTWVSVAADQYREILSAELSRVRASTGPIEHARYLARSAYRLALQ